MSLIRKEDKRTVFNLIWILLGSFGIVGGLITISMLLA